MAKALLRFAALVEIATGLALIVVPRLVIALLISADEPPQAMPLGRVAGIAILALGIACWPREPFTVRESPAFRGMLVYNALIAAYLAYLFAFRHLGGVMLWPAVAIHAVVAVLLIKCALDERRTAG